MNATEKAAFMKGLEKATKEQIKDSSIFRTPRIVDLVEKEKVLSGILVSSELFAEKWNNTVTGENGFRVGFPVMVNFKGVNMRFLLKPDGLTEDMVKLLVDKTVKFRVSEFTPQDKTESVKFVRFV
jgi:hypothetical protein